MCTTIPDGYYFSKKGKICKLSKTCKSKNVRRQLNLNFVQATEFKDHCKHMAEFRYQRFREECSAVSYTQIDLCSVVKPPEMQPLMLVCSVS